MKAEALLRAGGKESGEELQGGVEDLGSACAGGPWSCPGTAGRYAEGEARDGRNCGDEARQGEVEQRGDAAEGSSKDCVLLGGEAGDEERDDGVKVSDDEGGDVVTTIERD